MKKLLPKLFIFGFSFTMFGLAALQIFLGYALAGKTGHQKRILMVEEPTKFWTIISLPLIIGVIALIIGIISSLKGENK